VCGIFDFRIVRALHHIKLKMGMRSTLHTNTNTILHTIIGFEDIGHEMFNFGMIPPLEK
jgi:hypothetical protein